ncbi:hypothetical protein [Isoptericola sp. AK164]|uniref:hypothetical protein n=1 Tax=Isoptericola sp. AK164 TaxID=3024246 RepID=UPI0024186F2B|nr:hypothetical protein [Isoptericola sp. AK164]
MTQAADEQDGPAVGPDVLKDVTEARAAIRARRALVERRGPADAAVRDRQAEVRDAEAALRSARAHVGRLESWGPAGLLARVRGNRAARLAAARERLRAAEHEVDAAGSWVVAALRERAAIDADLHGTYDAEERLEEALRRAEDRVLDADSAAPSDVASELATIREDRAEVQAEHAAVESARRTAERAARALDTVVRRLLTVTNTPTHDTWPSSGAQSTMRKHVEVQRAGELMREAGPTLQRLQGELRRCRGGVVGQMGTLELDGTVMTGLVDGLLDTSSTDVVLGRRALAAHRQVGALRDDVRRCTNLLTSRSRELDVRLAALAARREELLFP